MRALFSASLLLVVLVACGGPTVEEAVRTFGPVYCKKVQLCSPLVFSSSFKDVDACVQKMVDGFSESDRSKRSACDEEEIDVCNDDIEKAPCLDIKTFDIKNMPASCQKC